MCHDIGGVVTARSLKRGWVSMFGVCVGVVMGGNGCAVTVLPLRYSVTV